jgi:hypothetical protein
MRIRIQPLKLMRIRIQPLKLMRIHADLDPNTDLDPKPWKKLKKVISTSHARSLFSSCYGRYLKPVLWIISIGFSADPAFLVDADPGF